MQAIDFPASIVRCGLARGDITPPVGAYHRMWGAARHDRSTGIHRPLTATALAMAPDSPSAPGDPAIYLAVDHCLLWAPEMQDLLARLSAGTGLPTTSFAVWFSHTHSAGLMGRERAGLPGGELIAPYLETLAAELVRLANSAKENMLPVTLNYGRGTCSLAANRDFWDERQGQFVCGYNPTGAADETVTVARATDAQARTAFTLVNYACHPTTLAWENTLVSPDYVGAMRETIESATAAPCLFVQGASGDLGPRHGFVGDTAVADRNGRILGHAALAAIEALPPPRTRFVYGGAVISGATLGPWHYEPLAESAIDAQRRWHRRRFEVSLPYRPDLPVRETCERDLANWQTQEERARLAGDELLARDCRAQCERMNRQLLRLRTLPPGKEFPLPVLLHRMGDAIWLSVEGEHYQLLQTELRRRLPDVTWIVGTLVNGSRCTYLPTREAYGKGIYQESIALLAAGSLERSIDEIAQAARGLLEPPTDKIARAAD